MGQHRESQDSHLPSLSLSQGQMYGASNLLVSKPCTSVITPYKVFQQAQRSLRLTSSKKYEAPSEDHNHSSVLIIG